MPSFLCHFCCFSSISSLLSNPILCRKKFLLLQKWKGGWSSLATNSKLYILHSACCNLASYLYNQVSNNQCVCAPTISSHVRKAEMALPDRLFHIFKGILLILKLKSIIRNTVWLKRWKF